MEPRPNPWSERSLRDHWDAIAEACPDPAWLPMATPTLAGLERQRLGCGSYGCVYRTQQDGLVLKISSDPSEVEFIRRARTIGHWPDGIVRYEAALDLPDQRRGRGVFVVWREEARSVGQHDMSHYAYREFSKNHELYLAAAGWIRQRSMRPTWPKLLASAGSSAAWARANVSLDFWQGLLPGPSLGHMLPRQRVAAVLARHRGPPALAAAIRICQLAFEMNSHVAYAYTVGEALAFYLEEHQMLLADVHYNNIGICDRPDYSDGLRVITDPGHMIDLAGYAGL